MAYVNPAINAIKIDANGGLVDWFDKLGAALQWMRESVRQVQVPCHHDDRTCELPTYYIPAL
jgi:hypothetical protein